MELSDLLENINEISSSAELHDDVGLYLYLKGNTEKYKLTGLNGRIELKLVSKKNIPKEGEVSLHEEYMWSANSSPTPEEKYRRPHIDKRLTIVEVVDKVNLDKEKKLVEIIIKRYSIELIDKTTPQYIQ